MPRHSVIQHIPSYQLPDYELVHQAAPVGTVLSRIEGFELHTTDGLRAALGPVKSEFYSVGFCEAGNVSIEIDLESYRHVPHSLNFRAPNRIFSLADKSADFKGIYCFFTAAFLEDLLPEPQLTAWFPFFGTDGTPFLQVSPREGRAIKARLLALQAEVKQREPEFERVLQIGLLEVLLAAKRSYLRQELQLPSAGSVEQTLVRRYKQLLSQHFLAWRTVRNYADALAVTPDHLTRVVRQATGFTASELLQQMVVLEAKAQLRHTTKTMAEIAHLLHFADPSHFSKFMRKATGLTPQQYRQRH
jgi:AraC family transcriptional activator of pobA